MNLPRGGSLLGLLRPYLTSIIMLCAAIWLGWLLWNAADHIHAYLHSTNWQHMIMAMLVLLTSLLLNAYIYTLLLWQTSNQSITFMEIILVYFPSQLAKYLPGKVWGIIYQAKRMERSVRAIHTWQVNIATMLWSITQALIVAGSMLAWKVGGIATLIGTLLTLWSMLFLCLRRGWVQDSIHWVTNRFANYGNHQAKPITIKQALLFLFILTLEAIVYIGVWAMLLPTDSSWSQAWMIASSYLLAWIAGIIIFIVPNGFLVREASFVAIGTTMGVSQELLLFYSIYARIFFMLTDIIAASLCWAASWWLDNPKFSVSK